MKRTREALLPLMLVLASLMAVAALGLLSGCADEEAPAAADAAADADAADAAAAGAGGAGTGGGADSAGAGGAAAPSPSNAGPVREGLEAPDFSYATVDGASSKLSDHRGSVVLINLWASWCGPCISEMPDIGQLKQENPNLVVLAVNVSDDPTEARNYIDEAGYDFAWILDESGEIGSRYPTEGIPYTIIVDKDGTVSSIFLGSPRDPLSDYGKAIQQAGI
jgi:thiol-disulfide isomerase/thioredoxin